MKLQRVYVFGAGKVGKAIARGLRAAGVKTTLRAARRGWPKRRLDADLVILAVRDGDIERIANQLRDANRLERGRRCAVVHCAGARDAEVLAPLRSDDVAVGQLHPLVSFADPRSKPTLRGAFAHVSGDAAAIRLASQAARELGMTPAHIAELNLELYHAAAAMLANGAAALSGAASLVLARAGVPPERCAAMLGPLLASVAANLVQVGLPQTLSGPVRRGDARAVNAHLGQLDEHAPEVVELYRALLTAQLPLAKQLGEASVEKLRAIKTLASGR